MTEKEWIADVAPDAVKACRRFGYLPSVLIAQTCLETGYGTGSNCESLVQHHNLLGMKEDLLNDTWQSDYWDGRVFTKKTPEWDGEKTIYIRDSFRIYPDNLSCLYDYLQFMRDAKYSNGTYKYRDVLGYTDAYTLISTVSGRGYCTSPTYTPSIMRIINKHNLGRYDKMSYSTVREALAALGMGLIDRIAVNRSQVPAHNANSHEYLAIHYLGVDGADNPDLYGGGYGGHGYVNIKGDKVYQAAEWTDKLWHVGASSGFYYIHDDARNANTIGIEVGTFIRNGAWSYTEAAQIATAKYAAAIMYVLKIPMDHLLRHGDITSKCCPAPYMPASRGGFEGVSTNWTWAQFKDAVSEYLEILSGETPAPKPDPEPEPSTKTIYRVQVGAYKVHANALKMLEQVKAAGFSAFINDYGAGTDCRYRVQIGAYEVRKNAYNQRQKALDQGFSAIVKKENLT